jgi:hypothetical protein
MAEEPWTLSALKEHLEAKIAALKENVATALAAADKAVSKAEMASERRFEGVNEFRGTLTDQAANFLTRNEYNAEHRNLIQKYDILSQQFNEFKSETAGRSKGVVGVGQVISNALTIVIAVAAVVVSLLHR